MSELTNILENFCKLDGVRGALVVGSDGTVLDSFSNRPIEFDRVAMVVSACSHLGQRAATDFALEAVSQHYLQYEEFTVTAEVMGALSLVIVADPGANLGRIRLEIRKSKRVVESAAVGGG